MPANPYTTVRFLSSGGFAEVHIVEASGTQYAQKRLLTEDYEGVERFKREVRLLQSIDHPNVVKVLDANLDHSPHWFLMPLYPRNLRQELVARRPFDSDYVWIHQVFTKILGGVEHLHGNSIIHRDLKPENILLSDTHLVVADLGLGRNLDSNSVQLTGSTDVLGTIEYAAPEQFDNSKEHSAATLDIYSLGKILFDILVDRARLQPFEEDRLPAPFRSLYRKATQWAPEARYQQIATLRKDFEETVGYLRGGNEPLNFPSLLASFKASEQKPLVRRDILRKIVLVLDATTDRKMWFEYILQMPADLFAELAKSDVAATRRRMEAFSSYAKNPPNYWQFEYTDRIGNAAKRFFLSSKDEEIRATLAEMTLVVGTEYNRYFVMECLGDMLAAASEKNEIVCLCQRLGAYPLRTRKFASENFRDDVQLPAMLRSLFPGAPDS